MLFEHWVLAAVGTCSEIVLTLDWTEFDGNDRSTLAFKLVTKHGRATPLMWLNVTKSKLKDQRNAHEDRLPCRLKEILPQAVDVCLLADRGFGDAKLYQLLNRLDFGFVIGFKGNISVTDVYGEKRLAFDWMPKGGRVTKFLDAAVTTKMFKLGAVVIDARARHERCLFSGM